MWKPQRTRWTLPRTAGLITATLATLTMLFPAFFLKIQLCPKMWSPDRTPADIGLPFEDWRCRTVEGEPIAAWFVPGPRARCPAVIVLHGQGGNRQFSLPQARLLYEAGYASVLMDLRHHGESAPLPSTLGLEEAHAVSAVVDRLVARPEVDADRIGTLGYSMGAVTALRSACVDRRIRCVVADSPFDSLELEARRRIRSLAGATAEGPLWNLCELAGSLYMGHRASEWEVAAWLPALQDRELLLIHGTADDLVPADASRRLAQARPHHTELALFEKAGHVSSHVMHANAYRDRVRGFLQRTLGDRLLAQAPVR